MPKSTKIKAELEAEIPDVQEENQDLQDLLDNIAHVVALSDEDEDEEEGADS
jgi:Skp family chaperone for outer membrane proteins